MPRQTRETELPKPPAAPLDWLQIANSGKVWDFIEGEDFTGKTSSYRARLKTAARKAGVDFESREIQRNDTTILKIKAYRLADKAVQTERGKPAAAASGRGAEPAPARATQKTTDGEQAAGHEQQAQLEFAAPATTDHRHD